MVQFPIKQLIFITPLVVLTIACTDKASTEKTGTDLVSADVIADTPAFQVDEGSGLVMAPGWQTVKGNCTACHSAKFITGQRGDRKTWESMIRWMQKTQGLWEIPNKTENTILDYLAKNYPPSKVSRRANLSPNLMPKTANEAY